RRRRLPAAAVGAGRLVPPLRPRQPGSGTGACADDPRIQASLRRARPRAGMADACVLVLVRLEPGELPRFRRTAAAAARPRLPGESLGARIRASELAFVRTAQTVLRRFRSLVRPGARPDAQARAADLH